MRSVVISLYEDATLQHSLTYSCFFKTLGSKLTKIMTDVALGTRLSLL